MDNLTSKELSEMLAKKLKLEKEELKLQKEELKAKLKLEKEKLKQEEKEQERKRKEIHKADIMNFEEEKPYTYTSDWSDTLVLVFDHYIKYLKGKMKGTVYEPWLSEMTPLRLADLDKKKDPFIGPVMFGEFLRVFFKNPFNSPFRKIGDRYQFPTKEGWRRVSHRDFFTRVRNYLWYHFRLWSTELLLVIGELEMSPRSYGDRARLKNLAPLLAERLNTRKKGVKVTYICEDDQVRFVTNWLTPRIKNISDVPCMNCAALALMLERCGGKDMITF